MQPADLAPYSRPTPQNGFAVEQAVSDLGFAAQFLTWAMRVQWTHIGDGKHVSRVVERACHAAEMPEGAALIAELTDALIRASSRPLSIPCPKWRVLTGDEARLLGFVAALQARDGTPLAACDSEWREPRHASAIWAPAQRLALAMSAAGFYLVAPVLTGTAVSPDAARLH
tara:strand:- start:64893 stop:65405 length:513 start_codon:yes stop_codon:yes gene_type:complete